MSKLISWLDNNLLSILAGFLLVFIPLYPKLPLFDILPGYIVRIRIEDFIVAFTLGIWALGLLRKKYSLGSNPLLKIIAVYLLAGIASMLSAVFITHTVPAQPIHVGKMVLHFLRRIEYFSLFFVFYSTIKSLKQVKIYIYLLILTMISVTIYGYGQKYLYWPAFSTMNREFSKGWVLYLSEHARVLSTFGGHYDLAAFTMMVLIILWSIFLGAKNIFLRLALFLITLGAFWLLILTSSRTSFLAYLAGIGVICFFWAFKKGIKWSLLSWIAITVFSMVIMLSFGDLSERFTKLLKLDERLRGVKSLVMSPFGGPPKQNNAYYLENNPNSISSVTSSSDQPPSIRRPSDVEKDIPLLVPDKPGSATLSAYPRVYSQNALVYDLSTGIRLDALWPRAIQGFTTNPALGTGYSTLTKAQVTDFTEAESTDNDFLRTLGETGFIGFVTFYGAVLTIIFLIWRNFIKINDPLFFSFLIGIAGVTIGLLINAVYIDVFEASKVAFSFWAVAGVSLGGIKILKKELEKDNSRPKLSDLPTIKTEFLQAFFKFIKSDIFFIIILLCIGFYVRTYRINTPLADWHSWRQADTSSVTRHFVHDGINILYPQYDDLSNIASGKDNPMGLRMVEFPLYNIFSVVIDKLFVGWNIEISQRLTTIFISLWTLVVIFKLVRKYEGRAVAVIAATIFAILPYNIYYSRVILPEPLLAALVMTLLYAVDKWLESDKIRYFIFSCVLAAFAVLVKPYALFFIPAVLYLLFKKWKLKALIKPSVVVLILSAFAPFLIWRWWEGHFPEGIPAYSWLFNGDGIRFKGAFFYWIFADRISRLILGYCGIVFLIIGVLAKPWKNSFFYWLLISSLLYVFTIATGNVRHDYYQILLIPTLAIFTAKGIWAILQKNQIFHSRALNFIVALILFIGMESFGWYLVRDYFNINHPEIVEAGRAVESLTPLKSKIIAPYMGDTAFLYQTGRSGWPIMEGTIDEMLYKGAQYYVSTNFDDTTNSILAQTEEYNPKGRFKIIKKTDVYVIIQLVPNSLLPKS